MTAWSWPPFGRLCHFHGGDVKCGRQVLWTPVVHPPHQVDVISHRYLQGYFNECQRRAECGLYDRQYSYDRHMCGLHLFNWFLRGHGEVHLHPFQFPRHILSLLVVQTWRFGLDVEMMRGHFSPRRK